MLSTSLSETGQEKSEMVKIASNMTRANMFSHSVTITKLINSILSQKRSWINYMVL